MKIGILCSSAGSTVLTAYEIYNNTIPEGIEIIGAVDRHCCFQDKCIKNKFPCEMFNEKSPSDLSVSVHEYFKNKGVDFAFLFFTKIIKEALYKSIPTINFHPSILPLFKGFGAIQKSIDSGCRYIGATAHLANGDIDGGQILAQTATPIGLNLTPETVKRISYVQKVLITLVILEKLSDKTLIFETCDAGSFKAIFSKEMESDFLASPSLTNQRLRKEFSIFIRKLDLPFSTIDLYLSIL